MADDVADHGAGLDRILTGKLRSAGCEQSQSCHNPNNAARRAVQRAPRRSSAEDFARRDSVCKMSACSALHLRRQREQRARVHPAFHRGSWSCDHAAAPSLWPLMGQRCIDGRADHDTVSGLTRKRVRLRAEVRIKYVDFRAHPTHSIPGNPAHHQH